MATKKPASRKKQGTKQVSVKRSPARKAAVNSRKAEPTNTMTLALAVIFTLLCVVFAGMAFWRYG